MLPACSARLTTLRCRSPSAAPAVAAGAANHRLDCRQFHHAGPAPAVACPTRLALRRGERAWLPRLRRAPRVGRCSDASRTRPCPLQTCGLERATLASCGKCSNHHPAHQASSAAIAKLLISRAIRQGGKERRIRTAKFSAIGESLADESRPPIRFAIGRWPPGLDRLVSVRDFHRMDGYFGHSRARPPGSGSADVGSTGR